MIHPRHRNTHRYDTEQFQSDNARNMWDQMWLQNNKQIRRQTFVINGLHLFELSEDINRQSTHQSDKCQLLPMGISSSVWVQFYIVCYDNVVLMVS